MTKSDLVTFQEPLRALGVLEGKIQWIRCPWCNDEVTKLRPCIFWNRTEQKTHVCVECAETVKGLTFIAGQYPVLGVDVEASLMPLYQQLPSKYQTERSYKARVSYNDEWGFVVWSENTHLSVLEDRKTPDMKKTYDNIFQVWFALKKQFEEGKKEPQVSKGSWK